MKKELKYKCDNCGRKYNTKFEKSNCVCELFEEIRLGGRR